MSEPTITRDAVDDLMAAAPGFVTNYIIMSGAAHVAYVRTIDRTPDGRLCGYASGFRSGAVYRYEQVGAVGATVPVRLDIGEDTGDAAGTLRFPPSGNYGAVNAGLALYI